MRRLDFLLRLNEKWRKKIDHDWPPSENKISRREATTEQLNEFKYLIKHRAGETEIHEFLEENSVIFGFALRDYGTGHHGLWVHSKQVIQSRIKNRNVRGLIPDFIIGGENSNGHQWFVVELKGANEDIFTIKADSIYLSSIANKGLCQLIEYADACSEIQSHLRDHFRMHDFREPKGILLIGTEDEFRDKRKQRMARALNKRFAKDVEIRTFNWLLRNFEEEMKYLND